MLQGHNDLKVYQMAYQLAMVIYNESKTFPTEERYSLTDQIRRSSRSVAANIAEEYRKRRYPNMLLSKLSDADSEATETQVWLDFAHDCGYLPPERHVELLNGYHRPSFDCRVPTAYWPLVPGPRPRSLMAVNHGVTKRKGEEIRRNRLTMGPEESKRPLKIFPGGVSPHFAKHS